MCDCVNEINAKLAPDHYLNCTMAFRAGEIERPIISLIRRDTWKLENRRGRRGSFLCSYCPFCGEKYSQDKVDALACTEPNPEPPRSV